MHEKAVGGCWTFCDAGTVILFWRLQLLAGRRVPTAGYAFAISAAPAAGELGVNIEGRQTGRGKAAVGARVMRATVQNSVCVPLKTTPPPSLVSCTMLHACVSCVCMRASACLLQVPQDSAGWPEVQVLPAPMMGASPPFELVRPRAQSRHAQCVCVSWACLACAS